MLECIISAFWALLALFGITRGVAPQEKLAVEPSPKLNKAQTSAKNTPTNLIREISRSAPNEQDRIMKLETMIKDLRSDIEHFRNENRKLAQENHQLRSQTGAMDRDQGKPSD